MRSWKTPAELQSDKSFHIGLPTGYNAQSFTSKMLFLRLSIDVTAFESDRATIATTRRKWRPPSVQSVSLAKDGLQTITTPLFQIRFSQTRHLRLDKRMIFPMMLSNKCATKYYNVMVVQRSLHKARRFTRMIMTRRTKGEDHLWDQHHKWLELHEVTWKLHGASLCRREQASKLRHDDRSSKGAEARLNAGNSLSSCTPQISIARFTAK